MSGIVDAEKTDKNTVGLMMTKVLSDSDKKEESTETGDSDE